jgi:hypothetical protein
MRRKLLALGCVAALSGGFFENLKSTLDISLVGDAVRIEGLINSRAYGQFRRVVEDNPQVVRVIFGDIEGSTDADDVVDMGYLIRNLGMVTEILPNAEVYSGGVDLFLAGVQRRVGSGAYVGVHDWETGFGTRGSELSRSSRRHEPTRGYIEDMLGSDAFYWFTLQAAPFDGVYLMNRGDMIRFGLITH